jgi:predicted metal-dependent phosphoesterase TrpH
MFVDKLWGMLPFLALGAPGVANLFAAVGALRGTRRAEVLGEGRYELLRDQHARLELLRVERKALLEELEVRTHNRRERQRLGEELERERLALSGDQRNVQRLERNLRELQESL